ncbi:glycosyltransferase [Halioglobus maricola]|uniref:Glycosyltransferase n=1 Tax=Halioglobus maricola TaxID=2601894 RepID=A0A5P9NHA6_9GAMM|nr:glycosyltransferase [Halioglobus maricola]QFU74408.1 glycosyltransferase [Halioglobus maricola]
MTRIALVCSEPIRDCMAGSGIRYFEMARALADGGFIVSLYSPAPLDGTDSGPLLADNFRVNYITELEGVAASADIVIVQGHLSRDILSARANAFVVVDLYDPTLVSHACYADEQGSGLFEKEYLQWQEMLRYGDFFLSACEIQRSFYLGLLAAEGRISSDLLLRDPSLRSLIDNVPFGLSSDVPDHDPWLPPKEQGQFRILFGGLYDWYDPWTLLYALDDERLADCCLLIVRNPNPESTPQRLLEEVEAWCREREWPESRLQLVDWVPHRRRYDLLRDVDLLACPHPDSLESTLSFRTRFMEALQVDCPVIATEGGAASELVKSADSGAVVAPRDIEGLRNAILKRVSLRLRGDELHTADSIDLNSYQWRECVKPLSDYCRRVMSNGITIAETEATDSNCGGSGYCKSVYSVLIATFNRMDVLPEVITALENQQYAPPFELIIINDGSEDDTRRWLDSYTFKCPTRVVHQSNVGPAKSRNLAIDMALGEYIALLGDDTVPAKNWLQSLFEAQLQHDYSCGRDLVAVGYTEWHEAIVPTPFLNHLDSTGWQFAFDKIKDPEYLPFNYFYGSNLSARRALLQSEKFSTEFPFPAWEDTELGYRLFKKGCQIRYVSRAVTRHQHPTDIARFAERQEKAGYSGAVLSELHPELAPMTWPKPWTLRYEKLAGIATFLSIWSGRVGLAAPALWDAVLNLRYAKGTARYLRRKDIAGSLDISALGPVYQWPIIYTPASENIQSNTGKVSQEKLMCTVGEHSSGHCLYGPGLRVYTDEELDVRFYLSGDVASEGDLPSVTIDIYDAGEGVILELLQLNNADLVDGYISLPFTAKEGQILEFRVYWHGRCQIVVERVEVHASADDSLSPVESITAPPAIADVRYVTAVPSSDSSFTAINTGWKLKRSPAGRLALYLRIDPLAAVELGSSFDLVVQYQDCDRGQLIFEYTPTPLGEGNDPQWAELSRHEFIGSGEKRCAVLRANDARLTGSHAGADFRLVVQGANVEEFDVFQVAPIMSPERRDSRHSYMLHGRYSVPGEPSKLAFDFPGKPTVSIIIPVYNNFHYTLQCLHAIYGHSPPIYEVIIVDDGSTDETADAVLKIPGVRLVRQPSNLGFAKACNKGADQASTDWFLFLNNDTVPQPGWLSSLIACAERTPEFGTVGSKLIFPQTGEIQSAGVKFGKYMLPEEDQQYVQPTNPTADVDREVYALTGASFLFSRESFFKVGGFDEAYQNGFEDTDICLKLLEVGRRVILCARSEVLHYTSASEGRFSSKNDKSNMEIFRRRWHRFLRDKQCYVSERYLGPETLPLEYNGDCQNFKFQTGERRNGQVYCEPGTDPDGHCAFGPNFFVGKDMGIKAIFNLDVPAREGEKTLLTLDIYDCANDQILVIENFSAKDVTREASSLEVEAKEGQILEFRVYWHGGSEITFQSVELRELNG